MIANKKSALAPVLKELRSLRQICQVGVAQQKTCFVSAVTGSGLIPPGSGQELLKDSNPGEKRTEYVEDHIPPGIGKRPAAHGIRPHRGSLGICAPDVSLMIHRFYRQNKVFPSKSLSLKHPFTSGVC